MSGLSNDTLIKLLKIVLTQKASIFPQSSFRLSKPAGQTKSRSVSGLRMSSADSPLLPRKRLTRSFLKTGSLSLLRWINSTQFAVFPKNEKKDPIHNLDLYYTGGLRSKRESRTTQRQTETKRSRSRNTGGIRRSAAAIEPLDFRIEIQEPVRNDVPGILFPDLRFGGGRDPAAQIRVGVKLQDQIGPFVGSAFRGSEEPGLPVADERLQSADLRGDDGRAGAPCLQHHDAERFVKRGKQERRGRVISRGKEGGIRRHAFD